MDDDNYDIMLSFVLIGNSGVGKSQILSRLKGKNFEKHTKMTIGVEFATKMLKVEGHEVKVALWDTAGHIKYRDITRAYYNNGIGIFVVYDITNKDSFDKVDEWIKELKKKENEDAYIILLGNKCDLKDKRQVTIEQGKLKAKNYDVDFMEVSAFSGENIEIAFEKMVKEGIKIVIDYSENPLEYYKNKYNKLKKENDKLKDVNEKLNNELDEANKIISDFNDKIKNNSYFNEIINLKNIIIQKDNELLNLKLKFLNIEENIKSINYDNILFVHFISPDKNINCPIKCLKTDTFAEIEEKLYQKYQEFRETNNNFIKNGKTILRFKKIFENNINDGDKIELLKLE